MYCHIPVTILSFTCIVLFFAPKITKNSFLLPPSLCHQCRRRPRLLNGYHASSFDGGATDNAHILSVSAQEAAAWLTSTPQYDRQWPSCEALGKCIGGKCALRWNHPACCYVPSDDDDDYQEPARPYAHLEEPKEAVEALGGYWRSKNFFCWR